MEKLDFQVPALAEHREDVGLHRRELVLDDADLVLASRRRDDQRRVLGVAAIGDHVLGQTPDRHDQQAADEHIEHPGGEQRDQQ